MSTRPSFAGLGWTKHQNVWRNLTERGRVEAYHTGLRDIWHLSVFSRDGRIPHAWGTVGASGVPFAMDALLTHLPQWEADPGGDRAGRFLVAYPRHWSAAPLCDAPGDVLEYRAAEYERRMAEDDFMETERGTLEAWHLAAYMESAFQVEGALYHAARRAREPAN
ncbi:hypothetical protein [Streptomyces chartreusis]